MDNIEDQFKELVRKADNEKEKKEQKGNLFMLIIEVVFGLAGFSILYLKLGGYVTLAVFLILTANNLQMLRNDEKK